MTSFNVSQADMAPITSAFESLSEGDAFITGGALFIKITRSTAFSFSSYAVVSITPLVDCIYVRELDISYKI